MSTVDPLEAYEQPSRQRSPLELILEQRFRPVVFLTWLPLQWRCLVVSDLEDFPPDEMMEMVLQAGQLQRLAVEGHPLGRYETRAVAQP